MPRPRHFDQSRRTLLRITPPMLASFFVATCSRRFTNSALPAASEDTSDPGVSPSPVLSPTPTCGDEAVTPAQTAGPFFTPDSPERTSLLEPGMTGTRIVVTGQVLSTRCTPMANALVDFWHTNDQGDYDNQGYTLRGHQFTDGEGRYRLETIIPGFYPGRTRHFHVKVQAANQPVLTTQLYFPEEPLNQRDGLFRPELLMAVQDEGNGPQALFDFVLAMS
ncbi:MAG: intradiol ring-cleavage dioxygenase [Cyanobacteria bacterium P01_D01_bin.115]